jgi:hypothetical protein
LIFLDSTLDLRSCEKSVENMENSEHFICIFGLWQLCLQNGSDLRFNVINFLVVSSFSSFPEFIPFFTYIKNIKSIKQEISIIDFGQSDVFKTLLISWNFLR